MTEALWRSASLPPGLADDLAKRHHLPIRVARCLCLRNKVTDEQVLDWLNPGRSHRMSPWVFHGMEAAVRRIQKAVEESERICIVGDYDVDGVTASTILATTLLRLKADWLYIIPHRVKDGYGLSEKIVANAWEQGASLIVTVDNGIAALAALERAVQLGLDVVVTDHHEPLDELPKKVSALIHWCQADSNSAAQLSGAGVTWKLAAALIERAGITAEAGALLDWHTALATLGALADVMPMQGENQALIQHGIQVLRQVRQPGWLALCKVAGIDQDRLTDRTLLWNITPRINAAGRMGSAEVALQLLLAESSTEATRLATQIEEWNSERKRETMRAVAEASELCERQFGTQPTCGIALAGPWPLGVVGIVAAKLVEQYHQPVIVFADDGAEELRGSGRAPEGFSLHAAVSRCACHLTHFGGHDAAVGCAVNRESLGEFTGAFAEISGSYSKEMNSLSECPVADDYLPLSEATLDMVDYLERFAPFGPGNPEFTFFLGPVEIIELSPIGKGNHLRLRVREGKHTLELIWFQAPKEAAEWPMSAQISVIGTLERNDWRGTSRVQVRIQEAHRLEGLVSREDFGYLYRLLRARRKLLLEDGFAALGSRQEVQPQAQRQLDATQVVFDTFVELGFAVQDRSAYHVVEQVVPRDLRDSLSYQTHLRAAMNPNLASKESQHELIL